jgi:hypothetical protein
MANNFTNNLVKNVGTSAVIAYDPPPSMKSIIIELDAANVTNNNCTVSVFIRRSAVDYYIVKDVPLPIGSSLQVISGQKIIILDTDVVYVQSSVANSIDVVVSVLQDVQ